MAALLGRSSITLAQRRQSHRPILCKQGLLGSSLFLSLRSLSEAVPPGSSSNCFHCLLH